MVPFPTLRFLFDVADGLPCQHKAHFHFGDMYLLGRATGVSVAFLLEMPIAMGVESQDLLNIIVCVHILSVALLILLALSKGTPHTDVRCEVMHVQVEHEHVYPDDLTGQILPPELVEAARAKEL